MTPAEAVLSRRLVASGLTSREADLVCAGLKTRAFFMSRVESVRLLQAARSRIAGMLDAAANPDSGAVQSRAEAIAAIRREAEAEGLGDGTGGLADRASLARAKLVVDTNAGMAAGYAARTVECSRGARAAYPAWRLVRVEGRMAPRDWAGRWNAARAELGAATTATMALNANGPMVALKEDPIWTAISRFGQPWPPFDYNSGMGTEEVPRSECEALGLVAPDWAPEGDPVRDFNASLEAQCEFRGREDPGWKFLEQSFGDQVRYRDGRVQWQGDILQDMLERKLSEKDYQDGVRLGWATPEALAKAREAGIRGVGGRQLNVTPDRLLHIYRDHVLGDPDERSERLRREDLDLIPHAWRSPDRVRKLETGAWGFEIDSADGGTWRLVVEPFDNGLKPKTFYKVKAAGVRGAPMGGGSPAAAAGGRAKG